MIIDGVKTVTSAGTRVRLVASSTKASWAQIQALASNTGSVYVGGVTIASGRGLQLAAGEVLPILPAANRAFDLYDVWVDSGVNGEGVSFAAEQIV